MNPDHRKTKARVVERMTTTKPVQGLPIKARINHPYARPEHWYRVFKTYGETYVTLKGYRFVVKVGIKQTENDQEQKYLHCMTTEQLQIEIDRRRKNNG